MAYRAGAGFGFQMNCAEVETQEDSPFLSFSGLPHSLLLYPMVLLVLPSSLVRVCVLCNNEMRQGQSCVFLTSSILFHFCPPISQPPPHCRGSASVSLCPAPLPLRTSVPDGSPVSPAGRPGRLIDSDRCYVHLLQSLLFPRPSHPAAICEAAGNRTVAIP